MSQNVPSQQALPRPLPRFARLEQPVNVNDELEWQRWVYYAHELNRYWRTTCARRPQPTPAS